MRTLVYIATSIDGYIAREDGGLDWLTSFPNPSNDDYGYAEFMSRVDAVIMGRSTFEAVLGFGDWPYTKPVFVLSRTLDRLPAQVEGKAELLRGEPGDILSTLAARGFGTVYLDGGRTIQAFLKEDLVDELTITRIPIILGRGVPLFGGGGQELVFDHAGTTVYDRALAKSVYVRRRSQPTGGSGMKVTVDDLLGWKPKDIARLFEAFSVEETATAMHGMSNELQQHILASIRLQRRWRIMVSPVHRTSMPLKDVEAIHRRIEAVAGNILEGKAGGAKP